MGNFSEIQAASPKLAAEMTRYGWNKDGYMFTWGRVVGGDAGGVTLERDGRTFNVAGPCVTIDAVESDGNRYCAIVRYD